MTIMLPPMIAILTKIAAMMIIHLVFEKLTLITVIMMNL